MSSRWSPRVLASVLAGLFVAACVASTAQATVIAEWKFDPTDFYADSSNNGHFLNGTVASSADAPAGSGLAGSASFDGTNILGVGTSGPIDLSPYSHIRISWWQKVTSDNLGIVLEDSTNYNHSPGGFLVTANEGTAGTGYACYNTGTAPNYDSFSHSHGTGAAWEQISLDFDLTTANLSDRTVVSVNGVAGADVLTPDGTSPFRNDFFHIGGRWGDGDTHPLYVFTGLIADMKIEGTATPEPTSAILLVTALIGLVCYAWRKRK